MFMHELTQIQRACRLQLRYAENFAFQIRVGLNIGLDYQIPRREPDLVTHDDDISLAFDGRQHSHVGSHTSDLARPGDHGRNGLRSDVESRRFDIESFLFEKTKRLRFKNIPLIAGLRDVSVLDFLEPLGR